jgi:hypothetical protein
VVFIEGEGFAMTVLLTLILLAQVPAATPNRLSPVVPAAAPDLAHLAEQDQTIRGPRVALEVLGGAVTGVAAGLAGGLIYCQLASCRGLDGFSGLAVGVLTAPLGISAGATLMGLLLDGNGSYWASTLGALAGTGADALILAADSDGSTFAGVMLVLLPLAGASVGYEWTSVAHRSALEHVTLTPIARAGPHGMTGLALAGTF